MAAFVGDHNFAPDFIDAPTEAALKRKIKNLQAMDGAEYRYISIYHNTNTNRVCAWFYKLNDNKEELQEIIDGTSKE